jgi:hypothetical protein
MPTKRRKKKVVEKAVTVSGSPSPQKPRRAALPPQVALGTPRFADDRPGSEDPKPGRPGSGSQNS